MPELILEPSATATWHRVVSEAVRHTAADLDEDCESYLVFLLMRYLRRSELSGSVLALEFLESLHQQQTSLRRDALQGVGDRCLILAGLFPEQAARRRVRLSYFVNLGKTAYGEVAERTPETTAALFNELAEAFVVLIDVLHAVRSRDEAAGLSAIEAAELALDTGSADAAERLSRLTGATLIDPGSHKH